MREQPQQRKRESKMTNTDSMQNEQLVEDVLEVLECEGGQASLSSIKEHLIDKGWKRLGNNVEVTDMLIILGFTPEYIYKNGTQSITRTDFTI